MLKGRACSYSAGSFFCFDKGQGISSRNEHSEYGEGSEYSGDGLEGGGRKECYFAAPRALSVEKDV